MMSQMEINPTVEQTNPIQIEEILKTHKKLIKIKDALNDIIDSMINQPSLLSQAAKYWSEIPLWQKIGVGILLIAPALLIGLFVHVAVLTTLSVVTLLAYTASSYLLDDHFTDHSLSLDKLKKGIASLADLLSSMVELLDLLNKQLAEEVCRFKDNNALLSNQVDALDAEIDELNHKIEQMSEAQQKLHQIQVDLENESLQLKKDNREQSNLLQQTEAHLHQVINEHHLNQIELSTQIIELTEAKEKIEVELEKLRQFAMTLQKLNDQLISTLSMSKEQQINFMERINEFVSDKEKTLEHVIGTFCKNTDALSQTKDEYKLSIERHKRLVDHYEQLVKRFQEIVIDKEQKVAVSEPQKGTAKALSQFGLYSVDLPGTALNQNDDHLIYSSTEVK